MKIKVIQNSPHCSYEHFCEFRNVLATLVGIKLEEYSGFSSFGTKDPALIEHAIMPLLSLQDHDAVLTPNNCSSIYWGLDEINKSLDVKKFVAEYWSTNYLELIKYFKDVCWYASVHDHYIMVEYDAPYAG